MKKTYPRIIDRETGTAGYVLDGKTDIDKIVIREDKMIEIYLKPTGVVRFQAIRDVEHYEEGNIAIGIGMDFQK